MTPVVNQEQKIILFQDKKIRRIWFEYEWFFSVIDIIAVLTGSANPRDYWYKMKIRVLSDDGLQLSTICRQLKITATDGKNRKTDCANTENILRISQQEQPDTFHQNKAVAQRGGKVAGNARKDTERELGRSVVSKDNYLEHQASLTPQTPIEHDDE